MTFTPYHDKIEVAPIKREGPLSLGDEDYDAGEVVAIGAGVKTVGVGDILFFLPHGRWEAVEPDGTKHYVVPEREEYILGVIPKQ